MDNSTGHVKEIYLRSFSAVGFIQLFIGDANIVIDDFSFIHCLVLIKINITFGTMLSCGYPM
jgi:hypothetical protein